MAIYRYRLHEDPDGRRFIVGPELDEQRCHYCGGEASPQLCPSPDGRYHHHGECHLPGGELVAVCNDCIGKARQEWAS